MAIHEVFQEICPLPHAYGLESSNVIVIKTPSSFHEHLIESISQAKRQISISSLYLGSGKLEVELVNALRQACISHPDIEIKIVFDYSRGMRGHDRNKSSVAMLQPLIREFPQNIHLSLYRVPQLRGFTSLLPSPWNETVGVLHLKAYVFDQTVIMTGANLSQDYFTNRQDRYLRLDQSGGLAAFYHNLVGILSSYSYTVAPDSKDLIRPKVKDNKSFQSQLHEAMKSTAPETETAQMDTWAFPTLQFTPLDIRYDEEVVKKLIPSLPDEIELQIASGYMNFPSFLTQLLKSSRAKIETLTASPAANGFYNGRAIKGAVPMAYSLIEKNFYDQTQGNVAIREFTRPEWTFHAKGLWCGQNKATEMTVVGSSNFGRRSYERDLESQVYLFTKSRELQQKLHEEYIGLKSYTELVNPALWLRETRKLKGFGWKNGHWIRPVTRLISSFL